MQNMTLYHDNNINSNGICPLKYDATTSKLWLVKDNELQCKARAVQFMHTSIRTRAPALKQQLFPTFFPFLTQEMSCFLFISTSQGSAPSAVSPQTAAGGGATLEVEAGAVAKCHHRGPTTTRVWTFVGVSLMSLYIFNTHLFWGMDR